MKTFSIYKCENFPEIKTQTLEEVIRDENLFGGRDLKTSFSLLNENYHGFVLIEVEHSFQQMQPGRAMVLKDGQFKEVNFSEYVEDITFNAYYHKDEKILIFQVRKEVAKDVLKNIQSSKKLQVIELEEKTIDFEQLEPLIDEYKSVWFSDIKSGGLRSASLSGTKLKEHSHFSEYKAAGGKLSYVTIPFVYNDVVRTVGITKDSAIILLQKYDNTRMELDILLEVEKKLLKPIWNKSEKQDGGK